METADGMFSTGKESEVIDIVASKDGPISSFPCENVLFMVTVDLFTSQDARLKFYAASANLMTFIHKLQLFIYFPT